MSESKTFVKSGKVGFPGKEILSEEMLKDGTFVRKIAQTSIVDHETKGTRVESLIIDEFRRKKKSEPWPESPTGHLSLDHESTSRLVKYLISRSLHSSNSKNQQGIRSSPELTVFQTLTQESCMLWSNLYRWLRQKEN
jgi:hypothetical protein